MACCTAPYPKRGESESSSKNQAAGDGSGGAARESSRASNGTTVKEPDIAEEQTWHRIVSSSGQQGASARQLTGTDMLADIRAKSGATVRSRIIRNATVYERYNVERGVLGNGLSGVVRLVTNKQTKRKSAMKSLKIKSMSKKKWEMLYNEVDIYLKLDHPFICRLQEVYEDSDAIHLIMELCAGKELYERLAMKKRYSERDAIKGVKIMLEAIR